jgi:hypothetical protein
MEKSKKNKLLTFMDKLVKSYIMQYKSTKKSSSRRRSPPGFYTHDYLKKVFL